MQVVASLKRLAAPSANALKAMDLAFAVLRRNLSDTVLFDVRGLRALCAGPPVDTAIAADPDAAIRATRGIRGITSRLAVKPLSLEQRIRFAAL